MIEIQDSQSNGAPVLTRSVPEMVLAGLGTLVLLSLAPALADPPASPPPCDVKIDPIFGVRVTDIRGTFGDSDRWQLELEFLNWTQRDAYGILIVANSGSTNSDGATPYISGASIDANGRPLGPTGTCPSGGCPPMGNIAKTNDWTLINLSSTQVCFTSKPFGVQTGTPIPHPAATHQGVSYHGLLSPDFDGKPQSVCTTVIPQMIPGPNPVVGGSPACITVPNREDIDDGSNVLDGFVVEIDDWDSGEQFSFNWWLIDDDGGLIGSINPTATLVLGDEHGFGSVNLATLSPGIVGGSTGSKAAPPPLFNFNTIDPAKVNTGYDPKDDSDPNADDPLFFAEDEDSSGMDLAPFNPIPAGFPGQGTYFFVEPGTSLSASPVDPADLPQDTGINAEVSDFMTTGMGCGGGGCGPGTCDCFGMNTPSIESTGAPHVGTSNFVVSLVDAPALSTAVLFIGFSNVTFQGLPLPLHLGPFGIPDCFLYNSVDLQYLGVTDASGRTSMALAIPNSPNLKGAKLFMQWAAFCVFPPPPPGGVVSMTNQGLVTTL